MKAAAKLATPVALLVVLATVPWWLANPYLLHVFIVTGISGAGKSQVLKVFEDFGFFCVDNLPIALLDHFVDLLVQSPAMRRVALGMDIREGKLLSGLPKILERLKSKGIDDRILFLDASDAAVIGPAAGPRANRRFSSNTP